MSRAFLFLPLSAASFEIAERMKEKHGARYAVIQDGGNVLRVLRVECIAASVIKEGADSDIKSIVGVVGLYELGEALKRSVELFSGEPSPASGDVLL